ncbi:ATP-binding protein [Opitutus terrae]|uniref:ATP-binding protein n=1 Tax=Opitutus terrae TaxID=107709 RepID=UPI00130507AF|nr:ATP-binding protein [Opitutus terrae]
MFTTAGAVANAVTAAAFLAVPFALFSLHRSERRRPALLGVAGAGAVVAGILHVPGIWSADATVTLPAALLKLSVAVGATAGVMLLFEYARRAAATVRDAADRNHELARKLDDLRRTNVTLQASEAMFRSFLDHCPALAWITDEDGTFHYVSEPCRRHHRAAGELLGRRITDIFPAERAQRHLEHNRQVLAEQKLLEFDEPGEGGIEHRVFKFPLRDGNDRRLVAGIAFDVTEQRRVRETLRDQSGLHAALGEAMRVYLESGDWARTFALLLRCALVQTRSEFGFVGVVLDRQRLRLVAGEGPEWMRQVSRELRAEPGAKAASDVDFSRLEPPLPRALRTGEVVAVDPPDGETSEPARGSFFALPILREKQVVGLLGVGRSTGRYDGNSPGQLVQISQQAGVFCDCYRRELREGALEEQLRVAQKMEAVGMLAGGVAHDFNNLLQVIQGYTGIALEASTTIAERRASLEQVRHASERATQLTRQLLAFGRRQNLQQSDLDLNQAIRDLLRMIRRLIGEQITVDFIPGHELGNLHADRSQIDQVLLNLCLNARDAIRQGGRITIETENVLVNGAFRESHPWAQPGRYVLMTVSDNGVGMDRETTTRIFEPFFTTKNHEKGTGLGLSVVYGVVKQHGGMVHVYSEPQKGTTFKIYLPIVERSATVVGPKHTPTLARGTETILLAEDEPMVRDLARRILARAGYRVLLACDGPEACALFTQHADTIALAILDVVMPQLGGREVYDRISALRPGLPVIFCSGYAGSALGADLPGGDTRRLLTKPYGADEMLGSVREALDQR